jgi:hypothetical protein
MPSRPHETGVNRHRSCSKNAFLFQLQVRERRPIPPGSVQVLVGFGILPWG